MVEADQELSCLEATVMVKKLVDTLSYTTLPTVNKILKLIKFSTYLLAFFS